MTKKHFKIIAARIAEIRDLEERKRIAMIIAEILKSINPQFDRQTFFMDAIQKGDEDAE